MSLIEEVPGCLSSLSRDRLAVLAALVAPLAVAAVLVPFRSSFPNTDAALVMLLVVVAVAANGYRLAGVLAALSVAVWFDFFLTQPYETVQHHPADRHRDDRPAAADRRGRDRDRRLGAPSERSCQQAAGYLDGISSAAQAVAAGGSAAVLIEQVTGQLTRLLSLRSCIFQYGVAGLGRPARLRRDGSVAIGQRAWDVDAEGFPPAPTPNCWWKAEARSRAGS